MVFTVFRVFAKKIMSVNCQNSNFKYLAIPFVNKSAVDVFKTENSEPTGLRALSAQAQALNQNKTQQNNKITEEIFKKMACYIYTDPNCDPCMVMTGERGKAPNPTEIGMEIIGTRNAPLYPPKPNKKGNNLQKKLTQ